MNFSTEVHSKTLTLSESELYEGLKLNLFRFVELLIPGGRWKFIKKHGEMSKKRHFTVFFIYISYIKPAMNSFMAGSQLQAS